jgi:WD40 repeat protein
MHPKTMLAVGGALVGVASAAAVAQATGSSTWAPAQKIDEIAGNSSELNTPALDGCPIESPDGRSLYMASNRPGGKGLLDIWVARRPNRHAPWGAPENLGEPVNSAADDFCPTPIDDGGLFFVSREALPGSCGLGDIYFTRWTRGRGWSEPQHLGCAPHGPNSALDEQGPSYVEAGRKASLYFSRSSATVPGDIYVSQGWAGWGFGPAVPVSELNDPVANDIQPNVRQDGREVVFSSNRVGTLGAQDIWVATRRSIRHSWSVPVNLGGSVNTAAAESRPSFSWDGRTLLFGRAPGPEGMSDIYVTTRKGIDGRGDDDDRDEDDRDDDDRDD